MKVATNVTPLAGVWIEIIESTTDYIEAFVTPLAGVWIEILIWFQSEPEYIVTPLAGVWIEMGNVAGAAPYSPSHSPCGSVD